MAKEVITRLNLSEVKDNLSKIVAELEHGIIDKVILCKNRKPTILLQLYHPPQKSLRGKWKGKVKMKPGFENIPEEFKDYI